VALGAMAGLGLALAAFLLLGITGAIDAGGAVALAFLQFLAQFAGGYVAGRLAGHDGVLHGSLAAIGVYLIGSTLALATAPDAVGPVSVLFFAVVAAVIGTAAGLLSDAGRRTT
jgi:hypothetical protein